jgi:hypothetical protein
MMDSQKHRIHHVFGVWYFVFGDWIKRLNREQLIQTTNY